MATASRIRLDEPLDTTIRLITPERITFQYPLAGPFRRVLAFLLDFIFLVLIAFVGMIAAMALSLGTAAGMGLYAVLFFVLLWFYRGACEAVFNGQTPGKWATGIRVVSVAGVPITAAQAVLRNLLWTVESFVPFAYLPAIVSMMMTRRFQRLGDLAAGTMVIVEKRVSRGRLTRVREPEIEALLPLLPARIAAGAELSQALADYVRHRRRFGHSRREEMAEYLAGPLRSRHQLPPQSSADAVVCALYHRVFLGD